MRPPTAQMLLIRYSGDNDFWQTINLFAKMIVITGRLQPHVGCVDEEGSLRKREQLARYFNTIGNCLHEMVTGCSIDCLKISPDEIFWGDSEVNKKLETYSQWGNGDSVLIYPDGKIEIV